MATFEFEIPKMVFEFTMNKSFIQIQSYLKNTTKPRILEKIKNLETRFTDVSFDGEFDFNEKNGIYQVNPMLTVTVTTRGNLNDAQKQGIIDKFNNTLTIQLKDYLKSEIESNGGTIMLEYYKWVEGDQQKQVRTIHGVYPEPRIKEGR